MKYTLILAQFLFWGVAWANPGDGVRLQVEGPAVPWAQITYEVAQRYGQASARVTKALAPGFGRREEVGLLPVEELTDLLVAIESATALWPKTKLADRARGAGAARASRPRRTPDRP